MGIVLQSLERKRLSAMNVAVRVTLQNRPHRQTERVGISQSHGEQSIHGRSKQPFEIELELHELNQARARGFGNCGS